MKQNYEKFYFYAFLLFAFTMPFSRAAISLFIIMFPLVWLIEGDFKRKINEIKGAPFFLVFMLFYALLILSALLGESFKDAFKYLRLYAYWLTMFVLFTSLKKAWIEKIITAFLLGMLVSESIAYGIFFGFLDFGASAQKTLSPFMLHIDYSIYLAFTSVLLFSRIISTHYDWRAKIPMAIFFLSTTGNLFLQTGRTGQVAFIFAIIAMFFLRFRFSFRSVIYPLLSLLIVFSSAFYGSENFNSRVKATFHEIKSIASGNLDTSWGIRLAFYGLTYDIIKENPWLGGKVGDYQEASRHILEQERYAHYPEDMREFLGTSHFHNQFLMALVQMGIPGFILTLLLYLIVLGNAWRIKNSEYRDIFVIFVLIYTIGSFADPLWVKQFTTILWVLFASMALKYRVYEDCALAKENISQTKCDA